MTPDYEPQRKLDPGTAQAGLVPQAKPATGRGKRNAKPKRPSEKISTEAYIWGSPLFSRCDDILEHLKALIDGPGGETDGGARHLGAIDDHIYAYHNRLIEKSAALLQTVAVIAAIEGLFVAQDLSAGVRGFALAPGYMALALFLLCSVLLAYNHFMFWPKIMITGNDDATVRTTKRNNWRLALIKLVKGRTGRHQLAVMCLLLGVVASVVDRSVALYQVAWRADVQRAAETGDGAGAAEAASDETESSPAPAPAANTVPPAPTASEQGVAAPPLEPAPTNESDPRAARPNSENGD